jgi:pyruvate carboxylase
MTILNGTLRPVQARDRSIEVAVVRAERADPDDPRHVAAPFAGAVTLAVEVGTQVEVGQTVATIEAMKMEANITAPAAGTVERLAFNGLRQVDGGDLILVIA